MSLRGLGAIVGTIGAGMAGYARGKRDYEAEQDRATEREQRKQDRAFEMGQRDRSLRLQAEDDALKASMKAAAAPEVVDTAPVAPPIGSRDEPRAAEDQGARIGTTSYSDPAEAQKVAKANNTPAASMRRQASVLMAAGKPQEAQQLTMLAKRIEEEGALDFIDANMADLGEPGKEFDLKGQDNFNAVGKFKVPEGARGRSTRVKLQNGQEINDFQVIDKDGNVILPSARKIEMLYGYSRAERAKQEADQFTQGQNRAHQVAMEKIAQTNADSSATLRAAQADAALARAQAAMDRAAAAAKGKEPELATPETTFDRKTAADIAKDTVKKEAEEAALAQKPMSGAQMAKRVDEIVNAMYQTHMARFVANTVQRTLSVAQNDPATYAQEYGKALKVMPQSELAKMGFPPPTSTAPRPDGNRRPAATMASTGNRDAVVNQIDAQNRAALVPLAEQLQQAKAQLVAAGRSGDPKAVAFYNQQVQQAYSQLQAEAAKRLGNRANEFLATVN